MTEGELAEWREFDRKEPIGNRETRIQLANIAAVLFNRNRAAGTDPVHPRDFMLQSSVDPEEIQAEQSGRMIANLRALAVRRPAGKGSMAKGKRKRP